MTSQPFIVALTLATLLLAGCAGQPVAAPVSTPPTLSQHWLEDFASPTLLSLVDQALQQNPSLQAAAARVDAARARADSQHATLWPTLSASLGGNRSRSQSSAGPRTANSFQLGANVSWEVDLWNRLGQQADATDAQARASLADYAAARLSLAANVANGWFAAIESASQLTLAKQRVSSFGNTLDIIQRRYASGIGAALDVRLAQENLASAQASATAAQRSHDARLRQLESLAGRYPAATLDLPQQLPRLSGPVPAELTSALLLRRPDITAAEQRLLATSLLAQLADKAILPGFRLTGNSGTSSNELKNLLDTDALVWSLALSLSQTLFDGGALQAAELLANANHAEALGNYANVVLTALREVETALAAEPLLQQQLAQQQRASEQAEAATGQALQRYSAGLTDIITLLETQRRSFNAQSNLLGTRLAQLQNRVNLHLALGGDYITLLPPTGGTDKP